VNQYFRELHLVQAKWAEAFQSALKISTVKIYRKLSPLNEIKTLQELGKELTVN